MKNADGIEGEPAFKRVVAYFLGHEKPKVEAKPKRKSKGSKPKKPKATRAR